MSEFTRTIQVSAERPYEVLVSHGARHRLPELVSDAQRVAILYAPPLAQVAEEIAGSLTAQVTSLVLPDGEQAKTAQVAVGCWDALAAAGFTRSDVVVGLGGGATTDLAGFIAATWLRGVGLVTMPTTVLGMVDAAVGGKTGINIPAGKNLVGAFHEPLGVLCDLSVLATLPVEQIRAGMAEVVKCGFIADPEILDRYEADPDAAVDPSSDLLAELISRGIAVKADVVSGDLREATSQGTRVGRELLNYGHTLGHAIERQEQYRWPHGEAISVGMIYAAELAHRLGWMSPDLVDRHRRILTRLGLPTGYRPEAWPQLRDAMALDKKTRGSQLRFMLLHDLGQPEICAGPAESDLEAAYAALNG